MPILKGESLYPNYNVSIACFDCNKNSFAIIVLEKTIIDDDKLEIEDNAQTIRPGKSPAAKTIPLPITSDEPPKGANVFEDYSDLAAEEDDVWLSNRVSSFKVPTNQIIYLQY